MTSSEHDVLAERLERFPADRYPVQHATAQFHLGSALLQAGDAGAALRALATARDGFAVAGMRLEHAKATVMLGVGLRLSGRLDEAADAFTTAAAAFAGLDQPAEQAAAAYNLGLVHQDRGKAPEARAAWEEARTRFLESGHVAQAAAAARDHGASLLTAGLEEQALPLLQRALDLAEQAGDEPGAGAAANTLGLAHLAAGDPATAVTVLRRGLGAFPRSVRPAEHAMVKANLALAYDEVGDVARARMAARQALAVAGAAGPVRTQAREVLARHPGADAGDLLVVLDEEDHDRWTAVVREEVLCWADLPVARRGAFLRGFLDGVLARPGRAHDLAESLLQVVLEVPPRPFGLMVAALVEGVAGRPQHEVDQLRAVLGSAMARFAMPQWQRLAAALNAAAEEAGAPGGWR